MDKKFGLISDPINLVKRIKCVGCGCLSRSDEHYAGISHCPSCNLERSHKQFDRR